jgi:hypothetical protein
MPAPSVEPSLVPVALDGRIILGRGTYFLANADGTGAQPLADPKAFCCLARISPDRARILTMPGTDETGAVRGGTLDLASGAFKFFPRPIGR